MESFIARNLINTLHIPLYAISLLRLTSFLWPHDAIIQDGAEFDYIIIGSGAGSVVANRLTEISGDRVLLIEAGDMPSIQSMYAGIFITLQNSYEDWQYRAVKEPASQSQYDGEFKVPIGKLLGGSSAINHFIFLRNDPSDLDSWAQITNDDTWNYENVLPYYKKSEDLDDPEINNSIYQVFHSTTGPIVVTREPYNSTEKFFQSFEEVGIKRQLDLNGFDTVGYTQPTINNGRKVRSSLAQAYIHPIKDRKNLFVSYNTLATKINFDDDKNARSVTVVKNNKTMTLRAKKEIILSAGVFNSVQLLMLSGIGPQQDLTSLNIPVISNLPVGQSLQDHLAVQLVYKLEYSLKLPKLPKPTEIGFPVMIGAVNLNKSEPGPHYQTTNLFFDHDVPFILLVCAQIFGYNDKICQKLQNDSILRNTMYTLVAVLRPKSRGTVTLKSTNPFDPPVIKNNFYSDPSDLDNMVTYIKDFIAVGKTKYFKKIGAELVVVNFDDCSGDFDSDDYIRCYAKHMTASLYHQTSTCPMGTVLGSDLKVIGVQRLRVVDASAFPHISRANPLATVAMLAEKASDMIKKEHANDPL